MHEKRLPSDFPKFTIPKINKSKIDLLITTLKNNVYFDYLESWNSPYSRLTEEELTFMSQDLRDNVLPQLLDYPEKNKLRIAICLSFIDSRNLSQQNRIKLGLDAIPHFNDDSEPHPQLFIPNRTRIWEQLCCLSEHFLVSTLAAPQEFPNTVEQNKFLGFEFLGCLAGKKYVFIAGLCFQTTEFPNGAVFIKDVWYMLRGPKTLVNKIKSLSKQNLDYLRVDEDKFYQESGDIKVLDNLIAWPNCGGVWQPTRVINQQYGLSFKEI